MPTPYRAMMRHLLGGDYHSPGASEDWSPAARESPARGQQDGIVSEGSPATPAAAASAREEGQQVMGALGLDASPEDRRVLASCQPAQGSASPPSGGQSADMEQMPASMLEVVSASAVQLEAVPAAANQGHESGSAQPGETPVGAQSYSPADFAQPAILAMSPIKWQSPVLAAAPVPTTAAELESVAQPLSAVPARLQGRALPPTQGTVDSPDARALVQSPGSEFDTPTGGEGPLHADMHSQGSIFNQHAYKTCTSPLTNHLLSLLRWFLMSGLARARHAK